MLLNKLIDLPAYGRRWVGQRSCLLQAARATCHMVQDYRMGGVGVVSALCHEMKCLCFCFCDLAFSVDFVHILLFPLFLILAMYCDFSMVYLLFSCCSFPVYLVLSQLVTIPSIVVNHVLAVPFYF